jgi:transcriptional regulator with XRE-family HTH domain
LEKKQLAKRIRAFRKLKGYTQQELAELLGISIAVLGSIERGTRKPEQQHLKQISDILNIDLDELISEHNRQQGGKHA